MASANITIRAVDALKPGEAIWDAGHREAVRGFGVRRQRGLPVYVLKYRVHGRQRFLTIGPHGSPWTPDTARREAKKLLGQVAAEKDPADAKAQARLEAADTLGKVTADYLKAVEPKQRTKTHSEIKRYLNDDWKPLHSVSLFNITRRHVTARVAKIAEGQGAVTATRARAALCTLFNWAIREGIDLPANPVLGSNRPAQPKSRDRVLSDEEVRDVWSALDTAADLPLPYPRYIRSLFLTACRRNEAARMHSTEFEGDLWTIPGERTKQKLDHVVPLTDAMKALIGSKPEGFAGNSWFIFSTTGGKLAFSGFSKAKKALDAEIAKRREAEGRDPMPPWRLHDIRRTARTRMSRIGISSDHAERCLGHVIGGIRAVYDRFEFLDEKRVAFERWADHVAALVKPPRPKSVHLVRVTRQEITGA